MSDPNVFEHDWEHPRDRPGFSYLRARTGNQAGSERLGSSVFEIPPGQATFPYHFHVANEEMIVVLRGRPHLRTPDGWRQLEEGELVAFPVGERGGHQVHNRSDETARVLMISEMISPEIGVYPDSEKFIAAARPPGAVGHKEGLLFETFRLSDSVDYWDGETPPGDDG